MFDPANPHLALSATIEKCSKFQTSSSHFKESLFLQIHNLADQLPIPDFKDDWELLSGEIQDKCLIQLEEIVNIYLKYYWDDNQTRSITTFLTLHVNIYYLSTLISNRKVSANNPKAQLQHYKVPLYDEMANNIEGLIFHDRKEFEEPQRIANYFKKHNQTAEGEVLFEKRKTPRLQKMRLKIHPATPHFGKLCSMQIRN